ncbi:unnamed protein product [Linum trigynum]|uniref:Uncharacterized protein n=1 Tax=Linum trigynum TaxID=586398 RepID=A0AAV2CWN3_9ROSI
MWLVKNHGNLEASAESLIEDEEHPSLELVDKREPGQDDTWGELTADLLSVSGRETDGGNQGSRGRGGETNVESGGEHTLEWSPISPWNGASIESGFGGNSSVSGSHLSCSPSFFCRRQTLAAEGY